MRKAALGERHVAVAASLKPLALMHWRMGEHDAAISLQRECCSIMTPEDDAEPVHTYAPGQHLWLSTFNMQSCAEARLAPARLKFPTKN